MCVGRRVIINQEAKVSKWIKENDMGYLMPYYNSDQLVEIFDHLRGDRKTIVSFEKRVKTLYKEKYSWEIMKIRMLNMYKSFE